MLFALARHEPLAEDRFGEASAREEIARIAARAERELDASDVRERYGVALYDGLKSLPGGSRRVMMGGAGLEPATPCL
jgi:hypothetical protein